MAVSSSLQSSGSVGDSDGGSTANGDGLSFSTMAEGGFAAADDGFDRLSDSSTWLELSGLAATSRGCTGEDAGSPLIAA